MATTSSWSSAAISASSIDGPFIPTVANRPTPAARARPTSSATGGSHASRWQWVSITASGGRRPGLDAREELPELADLGAALHGPEPCTVELEILASKSLEQPLDRGRHEWMQQHRHHTQPLGQRVEDLVEVARLGVVLGELPGLLVLHVTVEQLDPAPDLVECCGELDIVDASAHDVGDAVELRRQPGSRIGARHEPVAVALDHRERAAR